MLNLDIFGTKILGKAHVWSKTWKKKKKSIWERFVTENKVMKKINIWQEIIIGENKLIKI